MRAIHNVGIILLVFSVFSLMIPFSQTASAQVSDGTVDSFQKISDTAGGFTGTLVNGDLFGRGVVSIGDLDGDGVTDIAVGMLDNFGTQRGSIWIILLNVDGTVKSEQEISDGVGGFTGTLVNGDFFGGSIASLGDLDGAGPSVLALAVGAFGDGPPSGGCGGSGAVYILFLNGAGIVLSHKKIANGFTNFGSPLQAGDCFGESVENMGDIDGDGVNDLAVGAGLDDDGFFDAGAVYIVFLNSNGTVKSVQKLSSTSNAGVNGLFQKQDIAGRDLAALGDLNGDGVPDLAVCTLDAAPEDPLLQRGKLHMLFLNNDGTVKPSLTKLITSGTGGFTGTLENGDQFCSVENIGDINGDGVTDIAVGANLDDDGGVAATCIFSLLSNCNIGAVWILFLNSDGTVNGQQKISSTEGGFTGALDNVDSFGFSVGGLGDLNGDGVNDIAVGAFGDDDGASDAGAVWILFLNGATIIDTTFSGNVNINPGETTLISGGQVNGNVQVDSGVLTITSGSTVTGNVEVTNDSTVIIEDGSTVQGNVIVSGGKSVLVIEDANVDGTIETQNLVSVTITGSTINGNIKSDTDGNVTITGNSVNGNIEIINPSGDCSALPNTMNGNNSGCPP